jgi:CRP-like cAMP-binding protein
LAALGVQQQQAFLAVARPHTYGRNEVVCHEGDLADSLHLVDAGHLAVRGSLSSGAAAMYNVLGAGDYFGELALLRADHRRTATVVALEPSRTMAVAESAFRALCARTPGVERAVSVLLADRVEALSRRLLETMYDGLDRRVYRRLVELARSYGANQSHVSIPLSQAQLADLVGATRPSVNQVLQRLAGQHLVELTRGHITVLDVAALSRRVPG